MQLNNTWIQDIHVLFERAMLPTKLDQHKYHLLDKPFSNKNVFDIFTHHVLIDACADIVACVQLGHKYVLFQDTSWDIKNSVMLPYSADIIRAIQRLEKLIPRILPAYIIQQPYPLCIFANKYEQQSAEAVEIIEHLNANIDRNAFRSFNLNKIIKYLDQRGLKYLSTDYFQQANSKLLAANK